MSYFLTDYYSNGYFNGEYWDNSVTTITNVTDTITFIEDVTFADVITTIDTITFTEDTTTSLFSHFTDTIIFISTVGVNYEHTESLEQTLVFYDNVDVDNISAETTETSTTCYPTTLNTDLLVFADCVSYELIHHITISYRYLTQTLSFTEDPIYVPFDKIIFDEILVNEKVHVVTESLIQTLTFTDEVESEPRRRITYIDLSDTLAILDYTTSQLKLKHTFHDTLVFTDTKISKANYIDPEFFFPVAYATKIKKLTVLTGNGVITLPPPEWGDSKTLRNEINLRRAMSGKIYTYIKTNNRLRLKYTYKVGRKKSFELRDFLQRNMATRILINNYWNGEVWLTKIAENPIEFEFEQSSRIENGRISVELQFEGVQVV